MSARLLLLITLLLSACVRVKPYERELLNLPGMRLESSAELEHVLESREGSAGVGSTIGNGCGCN